MGIQSEREGYDSIDGGDETVGVVGEVVGAEVGMMKCDGGCGGRGW